MLFGGERGIFPFTNLFIREAGSVRINYVDLDNFDISMYAVERHILTRFVCVVTLPAV